MRPQQGRELGRARRTGKGQCPCRGHAHPEHLLGPCLGSKHGQDPGAAPHVQDHLVLEHVFVVVHGVPVSERPHLILQHLLCGGKGRVNVFRAPGHTHIGSRAQGCLAEFFRDLSSVTRTSHRRVWLGQGPPLETHDALKICPRKVASYHRRRNSHPDLGRFQFLKNQKKGAV